LSSLTKEVHAMSNATISAITNSPGAAFLMADGEAAAFIGVSRSTLWRRVAAGEFPPPIKLGGRTLWRRDELLAVVEKATAKRDGRAA
jgi:predicted DNA-binding transcriptional regulator AlpA